MLVLVHYRRYFLSGYLAGLTIYESFRSDVKLAPKIGSVTTRKAVMGSGSYRDTVIGIEPYQVAISPRGEVVPR